jgi:glycosyltransferase involved in cell wall biosynthesis
MVSDKKVVINLIQDLATPHNNVLIGAFSGRKDIQINLWYAKSQDRSRYQWSRDISQEHFSAVIYGSRLNISFLWYCLSHPDERFVIVGWMNINTRLLHLVFFLLRRPFNHWTDLPNPKVECISVPRRLLRWAAYRLLRFSHCKIFAVGKSSLNLFRAWGFPEKRLENLPIFVEIDEDLGSYRSELLEIRSLYEVPKNGFLLSAGSRLVFDKGYDLLIDAIAKIPPGLRSKIRMIIVGSGEEFDTLQRQINLLGLAETVRLLDWMDFHDFKALIANSDIFIHPARFDSYGGSILGMALGVPVIGSTGAGAAVDRIEHGRNGLLYEATNTAALARYISQLVQDVELRKQLAEAGRQTALQWRPGRGVDILLLNSI